MKILLLNAGSSSLKAALVDSSDGTTVASGLADWAGSVTRYRYSGPDGKDRSTEVPWTGYAQAVQNFLVDLVQAKPVALADRSALGAVGHRVVHGGPFTSSMKITPDVRSRITALAELAPLHNPPALEALAAAEAELSGVPHVAVFDTAFHATLPPHAWTYPVPERWTRDWGIRRFGFHGLSHAYCTSRAAEMLGRPAEELRLVICHLGHGCSAAAVQGGRCVDTTMGFTPLEGLMMGTRSGSIDPSIVLHVQERHGMTAAQVEKALNRESGLLGVSGVSASPKDLLEVEQSNARARAALELYARRVVREIGALTAVLGGLDMIAFTGGIGEHSALLRERICDALGWLGLEIDPQANRGDARTISIARSRVRVAVEPTNEEWVAASHAWRLLRTNRPRSAPAGLAA